MESMPDIIRNIEIICRKEDKQKETFANLLTCFCIFIHEIQRNKHKDHHTAVDVRIMLKSEMYRYIDEMPAQHAYY